MLKRLSRTSLRARVLAVSALVVVLGAAPAYAYWTAQTKAPAQSFNVGHLAISASKTGTVSLEASPLYPGATVAQQYVITNSGSIPLSYYVQGQATGTLGAALAIVVASGAPSGTFPSATCPGARIAPSASALPTAAATSVAYGSPAASRAALVPSATATLCLQVGLSSTAPGTLQGQSSTVRLTFVGEQVARP